MSTQSRPGDVIVSLTRKTKKGTGGLSGLRHDVGFIQKILFCVFLKGKVGLFILGFNDFTGSSRGIRLGTLKNL